MVGLKIPRMKGWVFCFISLRRGWVFSFISLRRGSVRRTTRCRCWRRRSLSRRWRTFSNLHTNVRPAPHLNQQNRLRLDWVSVRASKFYIRYIRQAGSPSFSALSFRRYGPARSDSMVSLTKGFNRNWKKILKKFIQWGSKCQTRLISILFIWL